MVKSNKVVVSGKRKRAVARAVLIQGSGNVKINNINYDKLDLLDKLRIQEPIKITEQVLGKLDFDVSIKTRGGGSKGQIEAARLALAKAISKFKNSKKLTSAFLNYDRNLLVADVRRKEAYKPGDSKARAKRQSSKR